MKLSLKRGKYFLFDGNEWLEINSEFGKRLQLFFIFDKKVWDA